jgi:nitrate reductase cytochrome c-type subunit
MSQIQDDRTRDLFEAAKLDGPSETTRDAMWATIQGATVGGVGSVAALKATGVASSKLALGIALGATLTVGIAATVVALTRPPAVMMSPRTSERIGPRTLEHVTRNVEAPPPVIVTGHAVVQQAPQMSVDLDQTPSAHANANNNTSQATRTGTTTLSEHDRLAREARMVSEARGALHRGEPETALRIVRAARSQTGARLVPEELTVEAQALRAMGDEDGAKRAEADLAGKFPEQAISH